MDYTALFNAIVDAVIVIDSKGQMVDVNPGCLALFGHKKSDLIGQNVKMLMEPDLAARHDGFLQSYLSGQPAKVIGIGREVLARHAKGHTLPVRLSVAEVSHAGAPHFVGILHDLSKQYDAEATASAATLKLQQVNRSITIAELGSALAHELNQPLTALILYLTAAQKYLSDAEVDQTVSSLFSKAMTEGGRAADILKRIRAMIENREVEREIAQVDLILQDAVRFMRLVLRSSAIEIAREASTSNPHIHVDPVQLSQVLINLIKNASEAIGATPSDGGRIRIRISEQENLHVTLHVEDSGPGFTSKSLERLFDPFQTSKDSGLGIGLSLSKRFIEQMGGTIAADNTSPLGGASVRLTFPIVDPSDPPLFDP